MNLLEKEFVPYEESVELKELEFDEPCFGGYDMETLKLWIGYLNDGEQFNREYYYPAPTLSQAFRWFRDKYNLSGVIIPTVTMYWTFKTMTVVESIIEVPPYKHVDANDYRTYEEAELACLRKLIEIVKQNL